jgi:EAL domain-containing protein (putative c-di-GMP-specific phosphodiesterase class I)
VKLDPSLIHDITTSEQARNVAQAVIQLVRGVDCELVAEAVETVAQADILRTMGCETIQGFVFAEPMIERDFLAWTSHSVGASRSAA